MNKLGETDLLKGFLNFIFLTDNCAELLRKASRCSPAGTRPPFPAVMALRHTAGPDHNRAIGLIRNLNANFSFTKGE